MRPIAAILLLAAAVFVSAAGNPPSVDDTADAEPSVVIDTPQDVTFGRLFRVVRNERGRDCVDVSGKLRGFELRDKPWRLLLALDDELKATIGMGYVPVGPDGRFECRLFINSSRQLDHGHSVRLSLMLLEGRVIPEPFARFPGILTFP
jgi:hypothetical protein